MITKTANLTNISELELLAKGLPTGYEWAIITHDLDDGSNHYHVALKAPYPVSINTISKAFNTPTNFIQIWKGNTANMWAYLAHNTKLAKDEKADYNHYLNDSEKFKTNIDDYSIFKYNKRIIKDDRLAKTITGILNGNIIKKELLNKENIEFYYANMNKIDKAIKVYNDALRYNPPQCETIYIEGLSGTGKTTYAQNLAMQKYPNSYLFASASNDPLQDYTGEKCLILDDWRPKDIELNQLLALIDPIHRQRTHKSRYYNKALATNLIIITSVNSLEDTIKYYTEFNKEDPKQLRRRIQQKVTIYKDTPPKIEIYQDDIDDYVACP